MSPLQWTKHPNDGDFAKALRRGIRMHRRESGRSGHRFSYSDIRVLWGSGDSYAIIAHDDDRNWQFWWNHPVRGWHLQSWHRLLGEAKEEAERPRILGGLPQKSFHPGNYVCAYRPDCLGRSIMVRCQTDYTASELQDVFRALGYAAEMKTVV